MSSSFTDSDASFADLDDKEMLVEKPKTDHCLPLRTILAMASGMGGLQVVWSAIFSNGTLYLRALELPETLAILVWALPALCGCFVQPFVGACSDLATHAWGRRRPYILVGAVGVTLSILTLAWAGSLGHVTATILPQAKLEHAATLLTAAYAILSICTLSLALQPLQVALRAIMLDQCPAQQQLRAQSWATRLSGIGQILGSAAGLLYFPSGDSIGQIATFRIISVVSILAVNITVALTCLGVQEIPVRQTPRKKSNRLWFLHVVRNLAQTFTRTSQSIRRIFLIQVLAWMGWFSFLFYNTSYITTIYFSTANDNTNSKIAGYIASFVTLMFSCVSFTASALLPPFVDWISGFQSSTNRMRLYKDLGREPESVLLTVWSSALAISAILTFLTSIMTDFKVATALIALNGSSWAITNWLPFAFIGRLTAEGSSDYLLNSKSADLDPRVGQESSGSISGLHNIAISAPQILAAAICGVILWAAREAGSPYGGGWVLRTSAFAYLAASYVALRSGMGEVT